MKQLGLRLNRKLVAGSAALVMLLSTGTVMGKLPDPYEGRDEWNPTDGEVALLPPYCQAAMRPQWGQTQGPKAYGCGVWFNHFCPGLAALNRAMNPMLPMSRRSYMLRLAGDHFSYTRKHMASTCRLEPDVKAAEERVKVLRIMVK